MQTAINSRVGYFPTIYFPLFLAKGEKAMALFHFVFVLLIWEFCLFLFRSWGRQESLLYHFPLCFSETIYWLQVGLDAMFDSDMDKGDVRKSQGASEKKLLFPRGKTRWLFLYLPAW